MENFDIGIIGGGPGGFTSALYYTKLGKSVVLFEKEELGGTCLNKGCIPTKAFLHVADLYSELNNLGNTGISVDNVTLDFEKVKEYKTNIVSKLRKGLEMSLKNSGVNIIRAEAELADKNTIKTADNEYNCAEIIIATGSVPKEIKGLEFDHKFLLSSDDILELDKLPKSILIVGSGAIGIEWARILSAFGSEVSLVELADRLCPLADWEVSKRIERQFKMKKIKTYLSTCVSKIEDKKVTLSNDIVIEPECILVATGRIANTVNNPNVSVIGDASAEIMLAHYAMSQAKELVLDIPFNKSVVPSVVYGNPEIAWVGEVSKSKEDDENYEKSMILLAALGKAHCDNSIDGFIKILAKDGKIKGASIIAPEASALIQQITIAMTNNLSADELKKVCYAHPTYSEGIMEGIMTL
ncbi:MAG: FAD-dependent oxidoreductase [Cyanobacteria bacterium RUI128]|nr:FAD-dependent oxidoreductase [Cyanobacteria bacterium RUI128]